MERFEERRLANAPIDHAWDILVSAEHAPQWVPFVSTATTRGEPGVGRVQIVTGSLLGISMDIEQTVDVWEPPHHFRWSAPDRFLVRLRVDLEAVDGDRTEITAR